ncbi:hypothetical protein HYS91_00690 [Candidatus Daviesbacteria bacterium]|nr:hypothetical protein [Candidatus Daviesbacteria bacterium]
MNGGYLEALDRVLEWRQAQREHGLNVKTVSPRDDRLMSGYYEQLIVGVFPTIEVATYVMENSGGLVAVEDPVGAFINSPFVLLHTNLQVLRRHMIAEVLERAQNFQQLPAKVKDSLDQAWQQLNRLPEIKPPILDPETIVNLSKFPEDRFSWTRFVDGFNSSKDFVKQTLAVKFYHHSSASPAYNRRAIQLTEFMLFVLDTIAGCTPWQLRWDSQGYKSRVNETIYGFVSERVGMDRYIQEGRMWSPEMAQKPEVQRWIRVLEGLEQL